jgi:hypothetical protein
VFISLGVVAVVGFLSSRRTAQSLATLPSEIATLPSEIVAAATSQYFWDTVAGPPLPARVGETSPDGPEGFVGRVRSRGDDTLWIAAFEGTKLAQVWKAGPFGTYSQGYQSTFTAVVGRSVLVTDYRATLHVFDLASGREVRSLKLTDRAKAMCTSPGGEARVWLEMSDEKDVLVDADAGTLTPTARPTWCPDLWAASDDCRGWLKRGEPRPGCKGAESAPKVSGFEAENVIVEGDLAVALGKKHPGSALPVAVGFDPKTKTVRWQESLAPGDQTTVEESSTTSLMDALSGGRFVAPYVLNAGASKGWHFTAIDARSGRRLWDVALRSLIGVEEPEGFSLSPARVYVMRTSSLEVYEAKTGALVGTIGE